MTVSPDELDALRGSLAGRSGRALWQSLDQLADTTEFRAWLGQEFPAAPLPAQGPDRRRFLRLMAASLALGGLAGCGRGNGGRSKIVPYVRQPPRVQPGAALDYASATLLDGFANGALVITRDGRPIKVEGNPQHPWTRGGTDLFGQASVLGLYDPDRSDEVLYLGRADSWEAFQGAMTGQFAGLRAARGQGLRLLTGPTTSPTLLAQIDAMRSDFPEMRWHVHAAVPRDAVYRAAQAVLGARLETHWQFDRARVVVALDGDFLDPGPAQVGASRRFMDARHAAAAKGQLLELHAAAPTPSLTSAKADHRFVAGPAAIASLADRLLAAASGQAVPAGDDPASRWLAAAWHALDRARGAGIVTAGMSQPQAVHEAVLRINAALGNHGHTIVFVVPALIPADPFIELVADMHAGRVRTLVVLDSNPAYSAAADLGFVQALERVPLKIHSGLYTDETAAHADWHVPAAHPLESWSDARSFDGTLGLIQPTIEPLYDGRSAHEVISTLTEPRSRSGLVILRTHWQGGQAEADFAPVWRRALLDGFLADSAFPVRQVGAPSAPSVSHAAPAPRPHAAPTLEVVFRPDPSVWDGAFANNPWLQELPRPLTKIVWDNVVLVAPALAAREQLTSGDVVAVELDGRSVSGPVWVMPGQADNTLTLSLGYGRTTFGMLASGVGYDAGALRSAAAPFQAAGAVLRRLHRRMEVVTTQDHATMQGHDLVRVQQVGAPPVGDNTAFTQPTMYPPHPGDGRAWGMVIDNDRCIGCNACVVACQAENNIPVVGREQVAEGREMHWLRIDRYFEGGIEDPDMHFMPVPCMHCEQAPCEVGCPVEATLHDQEGLNLMVYNRCIGTRTCSSYCPYKVRHFNWLDYAGGAAESVTEQRNPQVTVRGRGVMEKCTYCVQRIAEARIVSDRDDVPIPDGAVQTACQDACPTRAITFGDLAQPHSAVSALRHDPRNYALLGELNTRPRTTYLASLAPRSGQPAADATRDGEG